MKTTNTLLALSLALTLFSCKKEASTKAPVTKPVYFPETEYKVLAPYDSTTGVPSNLEHETVSADMLAFIKKNLPEQKDLRETNSALLNSNTSMDFRITEKSKVSLTFVSEVTRFRNAIAFYTYPTTNPPASPKDIKTITYFLPSAGVGTKLKAGDKVTIGTFDAGTSIGLVLMKDSWQPASGALNNKVVHFCYNDVLNPEIDPNLKKHVVLLNYTPENKILIGFEDIDRTSSECDHDFNDVVLYASVEKQ